MGFLRVYCAFYYAFIRHLLLIIVKLVRVFLVCFPRLYMYYRYLDEEGDGGVKAA